MVPTHIEQNLSQTLAAGDHVIGHLTWYDCRNASVTPAGLKRLFDKYGMRKKPGSNDYIDFPSDIKPKNAFQKACRQAMFKSGETSDTRKCVTKLIIDGTDKIVYGIVDLDVNEQAQSIDPDFSDRIWLDKNAWTVHYDKGHPVSKLIETIYNELTGAYTTRDISRMIVNSLDRQCSVSLRDAGVIYFVPAAYEQDLKALQGVVNDVGDCNMRVFSIGSHSGNSAGIVREAKAQVQDAVSKMKDDIAELKDSITDGALKGQSATNSITVRVRRYSELRNKCRVLADALRIKAEVLEGELDELKESLKSTLDVPDKDLSDEEAA